MFIALLVEKIGERKYKILPFQHNTPKLFCKFPLIGTEKFSFPVIINCSNFDVEKDRNAIHEGCEENKNILKTALKLYESLINYASDNKWEDLYNLCFVAENNNSTIQKKAS